MKDEVVSLRDYTAILRRRWRVVFVTVLAIAGGVGVYTLLRSPEYRSIADVQVESVRQTGESTPSGARSPRKSSIT